MDWLWQWIWRHNWYHLHHQWIIIRSISFICFCKLDLKWIIFLCIQWNWKFIFISFLLLLWNPLRFISSKLLITFIIPLFILLIIFFHLLFIINDCLPGLNGYEIMDEKIKYAEREREIAVDAHIFFKMKKEKLSKQTRMNWKKRITGWESFWKIGFFLPPKKERIRMIDQERERESERMQWNKMKWNEMEKITL